MAMLVYRRVNVGKYISHMNPMGIEFLVGLQTNGQTWSILFLLKLHEKPLYTVYIVYHPHLAGGGNFRNDVETQNQFSGQEMVGEKSILKKKEVNGTINF